MGGGAVPKRLLSDLRGPALRYGAPEMEGRLRPGAGCRGGRARRGLAYGGPGDRRGNPGPGRDRRGSPNGPYGAARRGAYAGRRPLGKARRRDHRAAPRPGNFQYRRGSAGGAYPSDGGRDRHAGGYRERADPPGRADPLLVPDAGGAEEAAAAEAAHGEGPCPNRRHGGFRNGGLRGNPSILNRADRPRQDSFRRPGPGKDPDYFRLRRPGGPPVPDLYEIRR